jgi:uncharacterized membrane protein
MRMLDATRIFLFGIALGGCPEDKPEELEAGAVEPTDGGAPPANGGACDVVPPTSCPSPAPKFADVQPIFLNQCGMCHGKDWTGQWPLDNYEHVADWRDEIRSELVSCAMPPADGGVTISLADRTKILQWIRCGAPH